MNKGEKFLEKEGIEDMVMALDKDGEFIFCSSLIDKALTEQLNIHSVVSTCCGKTKAMNKFLKRPAKYCLTCGKEIQ